MDSRGIYLRGDYHSVCISEEAEITVGSNVVLSSFGSLLVEATAKLTIEQSVFFNEHCVIRCQDSIRIGRNSMFGDGVKIYDHNHLYSPYHTEKNRFTTAPINIGKNCWVGANAVILKGVTIGDNVIIGAGSVVYKDIPSHSIVTANQGLTIRPRPQAKYHAFTYTYSDTLHELGYLVEHLPMMDFHIAAPSAVSDYLMSFAQYPNVTIYVNYHDWGDVEPILKRADIYLDNNYLDAVGDIINDAFREEKSIFSFENVCHVPEDKRDQINLFAPDKAADMVAAIKNYIEGLEK